MRAVMQVDVKESPKEGMSWDEKRAREKLASEADELDVEVKRRLGPDGFHVQVDGAERVAREVPNGECSASALVCCAQKRSLIPSMTPSLSL